MGPESGRLADSLGGSVWPWRSVKPSAPANSMLLSMSSDPAQEHNLKPLPLGRSGRKETLRLSTYGRRPVRLGNSFRER